MIPAIGEVLTALCMYFIVLKHYKLAATDIISSALSVSQILGTVPYTASYLFRLDLPI